MSTVFSHIIQKRFSGVNEDVATDALAYILESSAAARRGMQNLLAGCAADLPALSFKTQQTEGSIRPDMWGFAGNEPHVYIENKFWAGLTDNQPVSYLKELAKTYAKTWPHEYIVRDRVDKELFLALVRHIREQGYQGSFYQKPITYLDYDGRVYWTMGGPVEETIIINRCPKEQSYEYKRDHGLLPEE